MSEALTSALDKIEDADRMFEPSEQTDTVIVILTLAEINALRERAR